MNKQIQIIKNEISEILGLLSDVEILTNQLLAKKAETLLVDLNGKC